MVENAALDEDMRATLRSRALLEANGNLQFWYERLFKVMFAPLHTGEPVGQRVLEIGSGASPMKRAHPSILTSDVMPLPYLDHVFDCHEINHYEPISDVSLDAIVLTNVLHHLHDPLTFLLNASAKLRPGGRITVAEPYFSALSYPLYKLLHHEPVDFDISAPLLHDIRGPLTTSNQAMPHMIFFSRPGWLGKLSPAYDPARTHISFFSSLSYMMTGGISRRIPVPRWMYRAIFPVDAWLASAMPRIFGAFFVATLVKREP